MLVKIIKILPPNDGEFVRSYIGRTGSASLTSINGRVVFDVKFADGLESCWFYPEEVEEITPTTGE